MKPGQRPTCPYCGAAEEVFLLGGGTLCSCEKCGWAFNLSQTTDWVPGTMRTEAELPPLSGSAAPPQIVDPPPSEPTPEEQHGSPLNG